MNGQDVGGANAVWEDCCMRLSVCLASAGLVVLFSACRKATSPSEPLPTAYRPYRFDDKLQRSATVSASPHFSSSAWMAEPIVWQNFYSREDITWYLLRGRMGIRGGDLLLKGEGSTPVIQAPKHPLVEWNRYEALEIRMLAWGGKEIKIRIGDKEYKQKLGPHGEYHDYHFQIGIDEPGIRPLAIMPTDSLYDVVAIHSIRLVPRKAAFPQPAGRQFVGKGEEYRNTLYAHSPSSLTFQVDVPAQGSLHFGMGVITGNSPVTFCVLVDTQELYTHTVTDPNVWEDAEVDLSHYSGHKVKLVFETKARNPGAVGLWANPLLTTKAPRRRLNVLLYMIDTLRPDHTSLHGYARDTTPFLKQLGVQGVVFEDCQVQATWTKPSTASLLTSLYSYTHGIVQDFDTIPKGSATLAEQLRAAGYVTASVVANPFAGALSGLHRGFDYVSEWMAVQRHKRESEDRGTDSRAVNEILFPWLERHRDESFFIYAHTMDPHSPYRPPVGFEEKFANPAETPEFDRNSKLLEGSTHYGGGIVVNRAGCLRRGIDPDRFLRQAIDRYDAEILHNDWRLKQLVEKLNELGILENTLIIVVSDHGEEFWEHGWTAHGHSLYQELTNGIFLMWNPKLIPTPKRVAYPVQLIDVMPTVLDLLGLPIPEVVQGQSLAPVVRNRPFYRSGPLMTSRFAHPEAKRTAAAIPESRIDTVALVDADWKLIYRQEGKTAGLKQVELYNRRKDRAEHKDLAAQYPSEVARMLAEITRWIDVQKQIRLRLGHPSVAPIDETTRRQLRSLGYLGGKP